ncbi:MAG: 50S ribosome-binding GTPase [SAR324 cluster bacterium]|nr:50S ribosome-binding GTPase [SAR324 cluster bacterium]
MAPMQRLTKLFQDRFLFPKITDEELKAHLKTIQEQLPVPVIWLLGKTQSGKTSLIRGLTQNSRSEIGDGIRPCTQSAVLYDFPMEENCFVRFLDTRGIGESGYDPKEEMNLYKTQAHLLLVVVKAMDHAQEHVIQPLKTIAKEHPEWPILVVQTCLHEGYINPNTPHYMPYPFEQEPWSPQLPRDLVRSLLKQREMFQGLKARFVPVDFTLPEDGFVPQFYGLDPLWAAIETALPLGLRAMIQTAPHYRKDFFDLYNRSAHNHIVAYSLAAGGSGLVPVPFVSVPLVMSITLKMFQTLASIYQRELNVQQFAEIVGTLGLGMVLNLGGRELAKIIPGVGSAVSGIYSAATTYALGKTLCAYFSYYTEDSLPDKSVFQELYQKQFEEGRELLKRYLLPWHPEKMDRSQEQSTE